MAKEKKEKSAKPEGEPKKKKPARKTFEAAKGVEFPFIVASPEGFDFETFPALKKRDFTADSIYLEHRALECEFKAAKFRAASEIAKTQGSKKEQGKAKRLVKLQEKMDELKAQLTNAGVDVDALLAEEDEKK